MLELVAQVDLVAIDLVVLALAQELVGGDPAEGIAEQRAFRGQELGAVGGVVLLVAGQQRQRGVGVGPPGHRGGDEHAVVTQLIHLLAAVPAQPGQPP